MLFSSGITCVTSDPPFSFCVFLTHALRQTSGPSCLIQPASALPPIGSPPNHATALPLAQYRRHPAIAPYPGFLAFATYESPLEFLEERHPVSIPPAPRSRSYPASTSPE